MGTKMYERVGGVVMKHIFILYRETLNQSPCRGADSLTETLSVWDSFNGACDALVEDSVKCGAGGLESMELRDEYGNLTATIEWRIAEMELNHGQSV